MGNPDEFALVEKAIKSGVGGCVEWAPIEAERILEEMEDFELSPAGIISELIKHVRNGGQVRQVKETRANRSHRDYYYKVIIPMPDLFKKGLFVEMEMVNADPELPEVLLVNAHEQK